MMKKLTALIGAMLMLGAVNTYADGCPTQEQCNAINDSYGRAMCLQAAAAPSCHTTTPTTPACHNVVVTTPASCHNESNHVCDYLLGTNSYGYAMCRASTPATVQVCTAATTTTQCVP